MDRPRVLLIWPGGLFGGGGNFGVPQLVSIAGAIRAETDATVEVVDLDVERVMGANSLRDRLATGWDLVGISCYSSYDYLKVLEIARMAREIVPRAWIVTGGYHPSARPGDFDDPIDFVCVGDGELPMARLVSMLAAGRRPLLRELPQEPTLHPNDLPPYDWELLAQYRPHARRAASQAEIYLSRGCPYDCAFCMERAKRDTSWRAIEPERAIEEMHRLDRFLDRSGWTLFIADALFGMKDQWRKAFFEGLARRPIRAKKTWLLIRIDLVDRDDFRLMAKSNIAPGFGLESGDPTHLRRIRKVGKLESYLGKMLEVAEWAREERVPFGANIIVGHPGETEQSMRTSAAYLRRLFLGDRGEAWERETGMRVHRWPWWRDGDQEFLSEWVGASSELDYRATQRLWRELFDPIVREIPGRFAYRGVAREYFMRAVDEQVDLVRPKRLLHQLGLWHLWSELTQAPAARDDAELAEIARLRRKEIVRFPCTARVRDALIETPRERFVRAEDVSESAEDRPLSLTDDARSTISALHAYAMAFDALELGEGDELVELGGGSGYGASVARRVVGANGRVLALEIVAGLAAWARELGEPVICADAHEVDRWRGAKKVSVAFAVERMPAAWLDALGEGGRIVAPVGEPQTLVCFEKLPGGAIREHEIGRVRYVRDRRAAIS